MTAIIEDTQDFADKAMFGTADDEVSVHSAINNETFESMGDIFAPTGRTAVPAAPPASPSAPHKPSRLNLKPRMVSLPNMANDATMFSTTASQKKPSLTPYDSLKQLVRDKKRTSSMNMNASAFSMTQRFQSVFLPPSTLYRRQDSVEHNDNVVCYEAPQAPIAKRRKVEESTSSSSPCSWVPEGECELHRACVEGNEQAILTLVAQDRVQAARAVRITTTKKMYNWGTYQLEDKQVQESYAFALNLAIRQTNHVNAATLQDLAKAAPGVLSTPDGDAQESSLSVLFKARPQDVTTADEFLLQNPTTAHVIDRKGNTPLHIACQKGVALDTIRRLVILYPQALFLYNAAGENPLMVAQRSSHLCSEQVATYLWEKQAQAL